MLNTGELGGLGEQAMLPTAAWAHLGTEGSYCEKWEPSPLISTPPRCYCCSSYNNNSLTATTKLYVEQHFKSTNLAVAVERLTQ